MSCCHRHVQLVQHILWHICWSSYWHSVVSSCWDWTSVTLWRDRHLASQTFQTFIPLDYDAILGEIELDDVQPWADWPSRISEFTVGYLRLLSISASLTLLSELLSWIALFVFDEMNKTAICKRPSWIVFKLIHDADKLMRKCEIKCVTNGLFSFPKTCDFFDVQK